MQKLIQKQKLIQNNVQNQIKITNEDVRAMLTLNSIDYQWYLLRTAKKDVVLLFLLLT